MFRYIVRRLLQAIPTLLGVSIITFLLVSAAPGDPISLRTFGNPRMTAEMKDTLRRQLGLDQSFRSSTSPGSPVCPFARATRLPE